LNALFTMKLAQVSEVSEPGVYPSIQNTNCSRLERNGDDVI